MKHLLLCLLLAACAAAAPPPTPTFTVAGAPTQITVAWPADGATDHRVYVSPVGGAWALAATAPAGVNSATVKEAAGTYLVRVYADSGGIPSGANILIVGVPAGPAMRPKPKLSPSTRTSNQAPCVVWFNARQIAPEATRDWYYRWSFTNEQQVLDGVTIAHYYDTPGTFACTLDVYDGADVLRHSASYLVVVESDVRPQTHIPAGGAIKLAAGTDVILDGDVNLPAGLTVPDGCNLLANPTTQPVVNFTGPRSGTYCLTTTGHNVIYGIRFTSPYADQLNAENNPSGIHMAGAAVASVRNDFGQICYCHNLDALPAGALIQDCSADPTIRAYLAYIGGSDIVISGCYATKSQCEHILRVGARTERLTIQYNTFTNVAKSNLACQNADDVVVFANAFNNQVVGFGPLSRTDIADLTPAQIAEMQAEAVSNVRVESNDFYGSPCILQPGVTACTLRANRFHDCPQAILVNGPAGPLYANRDVSDAVIAANTSAESGPAGTFLVVQGHARGLDVQDNTFAVTTNFMGGLAQSAFVNTVDLSSFVTEKNNTWPSLMDLEIDRHALGGVFLVGGKWSKTLVGPDVFDAVTIKGTTQPSN